MKQIYDMGARRELAGEGFLITPTSGNCAFRVGHLTKCNVALALDGDGEYSNWGGYPHLVDLPDGRKRLYYIAGTMRIHGTQTPSHSFFAAETSDGITFTRCVIPESKHGTNCVVASEDAVPRGLYPSTAAVFLDTNPETADDQRFKLFMLGHNDDGSRATLRLMSSPDGLSFNLSQPQILNLEGDFDSLVTCFYDESIKRYRLFFRTRNFGVRTIRTAVTADFKTFESQSDLLYDDHCEMSLYTNAIHPYFRAPHIMTGFPMRYTDNDQIWDPRMMARPNVQTRALCAVKDNCVRIGTAVTDAVLILSRDGYRFKRYPEAILRPGPCTIDAWGYGDNDIAPGMFPTASSDAQYGAPDELSIYAIENAADSHQCTRIRRYAMRMDGMASLHFGWPNGTAVSRPFSFTGNALTINISTSGAGFIAFELLDAATDSPIHGFSMDDCFPVTGDTLNAVVFWTDGPDITKLAGRPLKLRANGRDADLYSLKFETLDSFPALPKLPPSLPRQPMFRYDK